jgi:hypothetical protein
METGSELNVSVFIQDKPGMQRYVAEFFEELSLKLSYQRSDESLKGLHMILGPDGTPIGTWEIKRQ